MLRSDETFRLILASIRGVDFLKGGMTESEPRELLRGRESVFSSEGGFMPNDVL